MEPGTRNREQMLNQAKIQGKDSVDPLISASFSAQTSTCWRSEYKSPICVQVASDHLNK
jgi:hypothetical protein